MKISIIIPTLNEAAGIAASIERAWAAGAAEVIVVDGGSADRTVEIAGASECQVASAPRGRAAQQNAGAQMATGDVLLFLHADCWLVERGGEQIAAALADERILGGAFRHRIEASGLLYRLIERGDSWRVRSTGIAYGDQGIFVRRCWFERQGGFPPVPLMEDVYLMRRLRRESRVPLLPGPVFTGARRWQQQGVLRQTLRNWTILLGERLGVPLERLARLYRPHGSSPTSRRPE